MYQDLAAEAEQGNHKCQHQLLVSQAGDLTAQRHAGAARAVGQEQQVAD